MVFFHKAIPNAQSQTTLFKFSWFHLQIKWKKNSHEDKRPALLVKALSLNKKHLCLNHSGAIFFILPVSQYVSDTQE